MPLKYDNIISGLRSIFHQLVNKLYSYSYELYLMSCFCGKQLKAGLVSQGFFFITAIGLSEDKLHPI
jgi:hypothetical protein